ncbi:MAG TPA: hypothetical protein VM598_04490 [Bdellovibrionota bacterium]|nr:hypothetical protein [Bdellovibrionota bacterium]
MSHAKFSFLVVLALSFVGCASREMPTESQRQQLKEVSDSASRAVKAVPRQEPSPRPSASPAPSSAFIQSADLLFKDRALGLMGIGPSRLFRQTDADDDRLRMQDRLEEALRDERCDLAGDGSLDPGNPYGSEAEGALRLTGDDCPVSFNLTVLLDGDRRSSMSITVSASYAVKDEEFRKLNDVDSIILHFSFAARATSNGGTLEASVDTRIHSQKHGDLVETGRGSGKVEGDGREFARGEFEMEITDSFAGFAVDRKARIEQSGKGKPVETYSINGNEVSKEEFKRFGGSFGSDGAIPN